MAAVLLGIGSCVEAEKNRSFIGTWEFLSGDGVGGKGLATTKTFIFQTSGALARTAVNDYALSHIKI